MEDFVSLSSGTLLPLHRHLQLWKVILHEDGLCKLKGHLENSPRGHSRFRWVPAHTIPLRIRASYPGSRSDLGGLGDFDRLEIFEILTTRWPGVSLGPDSGVSLNQICTAHSPTVNHVQTS